MVSRLCNCDVRCRGESRDGESMQGAGESMGESIANQSQINGLGRRGKGKNWQAIAKACKSYFTPSSGVQPPCLPRVLQSGNQWL